MPEVVDLNRRFIKAQSRDNLEESALQSYLIGELMGISGSIGWAEILQNKIAVILGEPGSGKSTELRQQTDKLNSEFSSFFVRLDRLVGEPLPQVLGEREQAKFINWKKSKKTAFFFFDSVDESKLRRSDDFLTALTRISDVISSQDLQRAHLIFSSRISEWRPETDLQAIKRYFPLGTQAPAASREPTSDNFLSQAANMEVEQQRTVDRSEILPLVVQILPLDADRVRLYAQWRGLTVTDNFMQALDTHHAWEFARRPLDVHALIDYWLSHERLGTLTELIEYSLSVTLRESEGREGLDPLTQDTARQGAEALAATALLCRNLNFKVPDDSYVSVDTTALDSASCLPATWLPTQRRALLTRTLFDGATYGCIRFHHRRTLEYLAASWLNQRMRDGCPLDHLDDLIFALHQGEYILRPTMAPVAAWLANGTEPHNLLIRERLLQTDPTVHLKYGDPESLQAEYKRRILASLVTRYAERERNWIDTDPEALARLADHDISADILAIVRNRSISIGLRTEMLSLIRHGCLEDCLDAALEIFADPNESEEIKNYAVAAIRDCGSAEQRQRLAAIAGRLDIIPSSITGLLCETLCPDHIDANGLADLLRRTERSDSYFNLPRILKDCIKKISPNDAGPFLDVFLSLLNTPPYLENGRDINVSQRYHWLCEVLPSALIKLLEKNRLDPREVNLTAEVIRMIGEDERYHGHIDAKETKQISRAVQGHPSVKNDYFWLGVERYRSEHQNEPNWLPQVLGFHSIVEIASSDIHWLIEACRTRQTQEDRLLALYFAMEIWQPYSMQWMLGLRLMKVTIESSELRGAFWKLSARRLLFPLRAFWYRNISQKIFADHWWTQKGYQLRHLRSKLSDLFLLHRYLNRLYSGSAAHWLTSLSHEAQHANKWAADDWVSLRKKRGPFVAWATQHGCEITWLRHTPLLPHEKTNPNQTSSYTVAGLCGLQSLWHRGKLQFANLSEEDAVRAVRHAVNELNGFSDWLPELTVAKPNAVRDVLMECIRGEWLFPSTLEHVNEIIFKLEWHGEPYLPLITDGLLSKLQAQDPVHPQILSSAIKILLKSPIPYNSRLSRLASQRAGNYPSNSPFFIAWTALWLEVEANGAIDFLASRLGRESAAEADNIMLRICSSLRGEGINASPAISNPDYLRPDVIHNFILLLYRHIRPSDDIAHRNGEAHSVTERDLAQRFRDALLERSAKAEQPEAISALRELSNAPELSAHRDWILHLIEQSIRRTADLAPWLPPDIRTFTTDYETDPRNDTDLYRIACWRLQDIKREVERSENSLRDEVSNSWDEAELRRWFQRKLNERSRQRYTIPQEAEIDQEQRPDLRFENPRTAAVPVELKWAENWTAAQLLERLENQLIGQYLRAHNTRYGIYLLGYIGNQQRWQHPSGQGLINYNELVQLIEQRAVELLRDRLDIAGIRVIAINFTISQQ